MTSSALEAKINKIRQQNEEIRRRHQEVEEDKKNAAKLNALVQMVPSSDWPERKEPPEFSNPPKAKQKSAKEKHEYTMQAHPSEGKKIHSFAHGEGPPPDPKYNFLADSEREEPSSEYAKESSGNKLHNKVMRGNFKKKTGGRENHMQKDNKVYKGNYRDESQPGYDAWRAERNRIDEDRISRQRTAEGNWRREWDNDKMHIIDDVAKKTTRSTLGDFAKKDHKDSDRRYHSNNNEYIAHSRGGIRPHRGSSKNFYGNYDNRSHNVYDQHRNNTTMPVKPPLSPTSEERTVIATDNSIKVTVNQGNTPSKGPVMSVKVNSPSIAGTGRVGPRQRTRVTYSHSDAEVPISESESFHRQKSFEDKSKGTYFNNPKSPNVKRSHSQKKKEGEVKYPYQRKEIWREDSDTNSLRYQENEFRTYIPRNIHKSQPTKSPKSTRRDIKLVQQNLNADTPSKNQTQEYSNIDSTKHEREDVVTENNETLEECKSELPGQVESANGEFNDKYEGCNNVFEMEMEEVSIILPKSPKRLSGVENLEQITKDVKDIINPDKNERLENVDHIELCTGNDTTANLQKSMSSEALATDIVESEPNEPEANVKTVPYESESNIESVSAEYLRNIKPASIESASIEPATVELVLTESVPKQEPDLTESIPKVEPDLTESTPKVEPVLAKLVAKVESIPTKSIPNVEPIPAELVPKVESVPTESTPNVEPVSPKLISEVVPVSTESVSKVESVTAELVPKMEQFCADSAAKVESDSVELLPKVEPDSVELLPKVEPDSTELLPKMEPDSTELLPKVESDSIKLLPKVEPDSVELRSKLEPDSVELLSKVEPVLAELIHKLEQVPTESVSKVELVPTESVPKLEQIPVVSVPKVEPVPVESVPEVESVPAGSIPKVEPVLAESVPKVETIPTESTLKIEPVLAESVANMVSVENESNNASNASATVEASCKNDQQPHGQISEQFVKDDCDNVKDEIAKQSRTPSMKDEFVSSLEAEAHSVINTENQLVCSDKSVEKQTLLVDEKVGKKVDENNECSDKKLHEMNLENTHNVSTVKNKKVEAIQEARVEL
ncbi:uncharacterized protein LOC117218504 [Megalopta genalis]|uniref:uncharacterized protein LOC117218504 n=1 Tax=Megalopta genalis TaxID=115081 RepID=UPI003FCF6B77